MRDGGAYSTEFKGHTRYFAKFTQPISGKNQKGPYIEISIHADNLSERVFELKPPKLWTVELSLDTSINFAEAIEFFRGIVSPSATIDTLSYDKLFGLGRYLDGFFGYSHSHHVNGIPLRDLNPNLIRRVNKSGNIEIEVVEAEPNQQSKSPYDIAYPFVRYIQDNGRKTIEYVNENVGIYEPTLEQILGVATLKLNPEDIKRLKELIRQPVAFIKSQ